MNLEKKLRSKDFMNNVNNKSFNIIFLNIVNTGDYGLLAYRRGLYFVFFFEIELGTATQQHFDY